MEWIEKDGFEIAERVEMLLASDSPEGIGKSMGLGTIGFAQAYARRRPDILLVLGDRFEMHAAVVAAVPAKIPLAHIHGGETTRGRHGRGPAARDQQDEPFAFSRHRGLRPPPAVGRRTVADHRLRRRWISFAARRSGREELAARHQVRLQDGFLLATYHPVTLEYEEAAQQASQWLAAIEASGRPVLFTMANADTNGRVINELVRRYVAGHAAAQMVDNLGLQGYFSVMAQAAAMVGNSSSGIIEAASFKLPVVNVGRRQQGRVAAANVLHADCRKEDILRAIAAATAPHSAKVCATWSIPTATAGRPRGLTAPGERRAGPATDRESFTTSRRMPANKIANQPQNYCVILGGGGHAAVLLEALVPPG